MRHSRGRTATWTRMENMNPAVNPATQRTSVILATRIIHLAIAVVIAVSIAIQIVLLFTGGADTNSGETGESVEVGTRLVRLFSFFTIDSNLIVMLVCVMSFLHPRRTGFWWEALRLNALIAIIITGLVYATLLAPNIHIDGWALVTMLGLHAVSPIGFVGSWLLLGPRPRFTLRHVPAAFVLPILWIGFTFIRGAATGWYPYPFLDVTEIGLQTALINAFLILAAGIVLALLICTLDARLPGPRGGPSPAHLS